MLHTIVVLPLWAMADLLKAPWPIGDVEEANLLITSGSFFLHCGSV